jgi:hypothetical protein
MDGFTPRTLDDFDGGGKVCPVLMDPDPDCYCFDLSSMKIPNAVKYCLHDFRGCDIYQRIVKEGSWISKKEGTS